MRGGADPVQRFRRRSVCLQHKSVEGLWWTARNGCHEVNTITSAAIGRKYSAVLWRRAPPRASAEPPRRQHCLYWLTIWVGRSALLQSQIGSSHASRGPAGLAGGALHRHALAVCGMHADPLRHSDRPLLLAKPSEAGRAKRVRSGPDRAGPPHRAGNAPLPRLLHGGHRKMASRPGRPAEDGLCAAAASRTDRSRV